MEEASIIGIDLAKRSFQVHGARADGSVAYRRKVSRGKLLSFLASQPKCTVAMEACAGAHYWGRQIVALGHEVRLVPPIYVKPFVKRSKNDAADAEAITEAAQRPTMHFVAVKTEAQQAQGMLFRTRDLLVRQPHADDQCASGSPDRVRRGRSAGQGLDQAAGRGSRRQGLWPAGGGRRAGMPAARADRRARREDQETRPEDPDECEGARGDGAADDDPGNRAHHGAGARSVCARRWRASGAAATSSAWLGLVPRQHTTGGKPRPGQDIEDGPAGPQTALDHRSHDRRPARGPRRRKDGSVAGWDVGTQAEEGWSRWPSPTGWRGGSGCWPQGRKPTGVRAAA